MAQKIEAIDKCEVTQSLQVELKEEYDATSQDFEVMFLQNMLIVILILEKFHRILLMHRWKSMSEDNCSWIFRLL